MKCEFKGKDGTNIKDYKCQNEATKTVLGKKKNWNVCEEHYEKMIAFKTIIKNALEEPTSAYIQ